MEKRDFDVIFDENKNALQNKLNDELVAVIIKKLRSIAQQQMKKTGYANQFNTLQPTAIVNETYSLLKSGFDVNCQLNNIFGQKVKIVIRPNNYFV